MLPPWVGPNGAQLDNICNSGEYSRQKEKPSRELLARCPLAFGTSRCALAFGNSIYPYNFSPFEPLRRMKRGANKERDETAPRRRRMILFERPKSRQAARRKVRGAHNALPSPGYDGFALLSLVKSARPLHLERSRDGQRTREAPTSQAPAHRTF